MVKYLYVLFTILFTTYGQLIIKWRINKQTELPSGLMNRIYSLTKYIFTDFFILSGFIAAYLASLCWMMALKKLQLNVAYPLMSLSFVLVFIMSSLIFNEKATPMQITGLIVIIMGVMLVSISMRTSP